MLLALTAPSRLSPPPASRSTPCTSKAPRTHDMSQVAFRVADATVARHERLQSFTSVKGHLCPQPIVAACSCSTPTAPRARGRRTRTSPSGRSGR
eukprot:3782082-Alexandrium_andersonii.AAC.1